MDDTVKGTNIKQAVEAMHPASLPNIYRLLGIQVRELAGGGMKCTAQLYHEKASLQVAWNCRQADMRMHPGVLVSPRWSGCPVSEHGALRIGRLVLMEIPEPEFDLFDTVPHAWVHDRELVARAKALTDMLPRCMKYLFNGIFWDGRRFQRFLMGPSSLRGHHKGRNGNLRHTLEVAETVLKLSENRPKVCRPVLLIAVLLHDAGKADEYKFNCRRGLFEISDRGALIGHKLTVLEWIAAVKVKYRLMIPDAHYLGLIHALMATKGVPESAGLREPRSLEAMLLSMADRLSGNEDLINGLAGDEGASAAIIRI